MPDRFELLLNQPANNEPDTTGAAFRRELDLLSGGLKNGVVDRLTHMKDNLGETALHLGACAGVGFGMNLAARAGGTWGKVATGAGYFMMGAMGIDIARRGVPTIGAMVDTWNSPDNFEQNKATVAKYAGSALVDYPVMMGAGYAGYRAGGLVPMRTTAFERIDISALKDATAKLTDAGLPINPGTRAAMRALEGLPPSVRANALKGLEPVSKPPGSVPAEAVPTNPAPRLPEGASMTNPTPPMKGDLGGKFNIKDIIQPNRFDVLNPPKLEFTVTSIRPSLLSLPIIPVDILHRNVEDRVLMGKVGGDAAKGLLKGLEEDQKKHEQPKQGGVLHELKGLELPKLELKPLPQAHIMMDRIEKRIDADQLKKMLEAHEQEHEKQQKPEK